MKKQASEIRMVIGEVVRNNPSREGCFNRLRSMGYDPAVFEDILDQHFEDRRRRGKARRQAEQARGQGLIRLLRDEPLPAGVDPSSLRDAALARRIRLHHRRRQCATYAIGGALATMGLTALVVLFVLKGWWRLPRGGFHLRRRGNPFAYLVALTCVTAAGTVYALAGWRMARASAAELEATAGRYGWW